MHSKNEIKKSIETSEQVLERDFYKNKILKKLMNEVETNIRKI